MALLILLVMPLMGCVETVYKTDVKYIKPEIPENILNNCDPIPVTNIQTNGDLLMSYVTLQSSYAICASKVTSIRMILNTYDDIYTNDAIDSSIKEDNNNE